MRRWNGSYRYETRVVAKHARGEKELQRKLQRLLNEKWDIYSVLRAGGFAHFTIVAIRKVRVRQ